MSIYNGKIMNVKVGKYYDIVEEMVLKEEYGSNADMPIKYALSKSGDYIGDTKTAHMLLKKFGIEQFEVPEGCKVVCIGYAPSRKKWYGWSHRAIHGIKVGDVVEEGDCMATSGWTDEYLKDHPEENMCLPVGFKAETSKDAKRMAIAFADSVS